MKSLHMKDLYHYNKETRMYELDIAIDHYQDMFNSWDAAPLKRKDIEPDLIDYLEQAGDDIPFKEKIALVFMLPNEARDFKREKTVNQAVKLQFRFLLSVVNKELLYNYRRMATFAIFSLIFLTTNYFLRGQELSQFMNIFLEGLLVGGWFLMWNVFGIAILDNFQLYRKKRIWVRYMQAELMFKDLEIEMHQKDF
jgi:hypothetical protein